MKKFIYLLLALGLGAGAAKAGPGDTTWVQANITNLDNYGSHDTSINFPSANVTYRKIYMIFTLGKHECPGYNYSCGNNGRPACPPGDIPWCADWDYTVQNFLMTPGGDTLELGRLITPYANAGNSLPNIPYTWTKNYVYDVTDYAPVLKNMATTRIFYSGYSGGFTANIKFAFIEGTPDRNVTGIKALWNGSFSYGGGTSINTHFPTDTLTAPANTQSATLKFTITGHGNDDNGCCEFQSHNYQVFENDSQIDQYTIWRPTCGANELYPQSGTWVLERGNWCPGAIVYDNYHNLSNVTAGTTFNTDIAFDAYTSPGGGLGSYTTFATLFYYGAMNKTLDASIDEIKAPNIDNDYFRENPSAKPMLHVKNTGSTAITAIQFQYGIADDTLSSYTWTGALASLHDTDIILPEDSRIRELSGTTPNYNFVARIMQVNQQADDDTTNNIMTSVGMPVAQWPTSFAVVMKTNNEGQNGICETNWQILDMTDNVVASRMNAAYNTTYRDTVALPVGTYRLVVNDGGCDGLDWWAFSSGTTSGSITVRKVLTPGTLILTGNNVSTYPNDFGCGFTQYFTTSFPQGVINVLNNISLEAYPNPAQSNITIDIKGLADVNGSLQMIDALGRVVAQQHCGSTRVSMDLSRLSNGLYTLVYINDDKPENKVQTRIVVAK